MQPSPRSPKTSNRLFAAGLLMLGVACEAEGSSGGTGATDTSSGANGGMGGMGGLAEGDSMGPTNPGCGSGTPQLSNSVTIDIDGTARTYLLDVPSDYDPNTPYPLVFVWHSLGSSAAAVESGGYNGLRALADGSAIFVAPDGLDGAYKQFSGSGWWNERGGDMEFLTAILKQLSADLCVDQERIFSTGFSFGGNLTYTLGFQFDVFRAIAPNSGRLGSLTPYEENNDDPLAIMALHGDSDTVTEPSHARDVLDRYINRNGCEAETRPIEPDPCVEYQGCSVPTIWCEYPGGHVGWSQAPQAIWSFFSQF